MKLLFPTWRSFFLALGRMQARYLLSIGALLAILAFTNSASVPARLFGFSVAYVAFFPFYFWWASALIRGRIVDQQLLDRFQDLTDNERDAVYNEALRYD